MNLTNNLESKNSNTEVSKIITPFIKTSNAEKTNII